MKESFKGTHRKIRLLKYKDLRKCFVRNIILKCTGCRSHFENLTNFKIVKEPLLLRKQTLHQQKVLDFSFHLAPWKEAWHYQEGLTMTCRTRTFLPHAHLCFSRRRGVAPFWYIHAHFQGAKLKLRSRAFWRGIVCFCNTTGSFRILKTAGENFLKKIISAIS